MLNIPSLPAFEKREEDLIAPFGGEVTINISYTILANTV